MYSKMISADMNVVLNGMCTRWPIWVGEASRKALESKLFPQSAVFCNFCLLSARVNSIGNSALMMLGQYDIVCMEAHREVYVHS